MPPKELTAFRIDPQVMDGMRRLKDRDGMPFSVQVDRALRALLEQKGVRVAATKPGVRRAKGAAKRRKA